MTAMGVPPAACFSDCHLAVKPRGGSDNTSPAWETSSPPACGRLSGWFLETLRRKAGLEHNKSPQGTWCGWACELWCSEPECAVGKNSHGFTSRAGEEIVSQSPIVQLFCCQSTSPHTVYVHKVCFLWEHFSYLCFLLIATSALQGSVTQPNKHPYPGHTGHSPTKALPGKNSNPK